MDKKDESCVEMNEIIYLIAGQFWRETYNLLLAKQAECKPEFELSGDEAAKELIKGIKKLAKECKLKFVSFSHIGRIYISLTPFPIYIGIDKNTGDFSISAPHINTKHFDHSEFKGGLKWLKDYINLDTAPLEKRTNDAKEKFYMNKKAALIAQNTITALCRSTLGEKANDCKIRQDRIKSQIILKSPSGDNYQINVYHKPFANNAALFTSLLKNPRLEKVEDAISCQPLSWGLWSAKK